MYLLRYVCTPAFDHLATVTASGCNDTAIRRPKLNKQRSILLKQTSDTGDGTYTHTYKSQFSGCLCCHVPSWEYYSTFTLPLLNLGISIRNLRAGHWFTGGLKSHQALASSFVPCHSNELCFVCGPHVVLRKGKSCDWTHCRKCGLL